MPSRYAPKVEPLHITSNIHILSSGTVRENSVLYSLLYWFYGLHIIKIITNIDEVILSTSTYLPWMAISPVISFLAFHLDGVYIGTAKTRIMRNSMLISFTVYILSIIILVPYLNNHGLWISFLIFMFFRGMTLLSKYRAIYI